MERPRYKIKRIRETSAPPPISKRHRSTSSSLASGTQVSRLVSSVDYIGFEKEVKNCYMCLASGTFKMICDYCPRTLCSNCISIEDTARDERIKFLCLHCHDEAFKSQPYIVGHTFLCSVWNLTAVIKGFYLHNAHLPSRVSGKLNAAAFTPIGTSPLKVKGHFQMTAQSQIIREGLTIIHFLPAGTSGRGSPAKILYEHMSAFLSSESLHFEEIELEILTDGLVCAGGQQIRGRVNDMVARG
jgi:hypothetical protein